MVLVQSSKLSLPPSLPHITTSILFEPNSLSLALMHSDSSLSLYPSLPFPSVSSLPSKPQTVIPAPSSSSCFILMQGQNPNPRVMFLVAGPHKGGSKILLRFYILKRNNIFGKAQVLCNQKGIAGVPKLGAILDVNHGVSIKVVGSINYFVMHSVSSKKVWVFALKLIGDDEDGDVVKLMRCAVLECSVPVWSMNLSFGVLILGEDSGVRVFNLKKLVKGKVKKVRSSSSTGNLELNAKRDSKGLRLPNGLTGDPYRSSSVAGAACNGLLDGKVDKHCFSVKRSVRCRQHLVEGCVSSVTLNSNDEEGLKSTAAKAVSVQALTPKKFLILDSMGDMHIMTLSNIMPEMRKLPHCMKVQKLAVLPDVSSRIHTVWVSDGLYSLHVLTGSEPEVGVNRTDEDESQENPTQISVELAIFSGEKIQDVIPWASNGIGWLSCLNSDLGSVFLNTGCNVSSMVFMISLVLVANSRAPVVSILVMVQKALACGQRTFEGEFRTNGDACHVMKFPDPSEITCFHELKTTGGGLEGFGCFRPFQSVCICSVSVLLTRGVNSTEPKGHEHVRQLEFLPSVHFFLAVNIFL